MRLSRWSAAQRATFNGRGKAWRKQECESHHCQRCAEPIPRRDGETPYRYLRRKFCGRDCFYASLQRHRPYAQRYCAVCESPIIRRADERLFKYRGRRFCGRDCFHQHEKANGADYAPQNYIIDLTPADLGRESVLYGAARTNAYGVGAVERTRG